eukprot:2550662-Rhodomonas_salina.1
MSPALPPTPSPSTSKSFQAGYKKHKNQLWCSLRACSAVLDLAFKVVVDLLGSELQVCGTQILELLSEIPRCFCIGFEYVSALAKASASK